MQSSVFCKMIAAGADAVIAAEGELTDIDSKFGDADHGLTMAKVMKNVKKTIEAAGDAPTYKGLLDDVSMAVMAINGGSAVPLWSTFFEGMSEGAPEAAEVTTAQFQQMLQVGLDTLSALSKAKVGDKTMMDTLIPAVEAIVSTQGEIRQIMEAGSQAAIQGAKASEGFVSKFGRAKSYKEQTIGTPDAGAVSMKYFFVGMNEALQQA